MRRFVEHVYRHPWRLLVTVVVIIAAGWVPAAIALRNSFNAAHDGRVENCMAVNELREQIYVAAVDLGLKRDVADRFFPTKNCQVIP